MNSLALIQYPQLTLLNRLTENEEWKRFEDGGLHNVIKTICCRIKGNRIIVLRLATTS